MARRVGNKFGDNKSDSPTARVIERHKIRNSEMQAHPASFEFCLDFDFAELRQIVAKIGDPVECGRRKQAMGLAKRVRHSMTCSSAPFVS